MQLSRLADETEPCARLHCVVNALHVNREWPVLRDIVQNYRLDHVLVHRYDIDITVKLLKCLGQEQCLYGDVLNWFMEWWCGSVDGCTTGQVLLRALSISRECAH